MSEWVECYLDDLVDIYNHKRVPLSKMQRAKRQGEYPYYGASGIIDYVDSYLFDGEYILVSEDGENLRSRKTPIAFKVSGKFWVNNHAQILQGKKAHINDLLIYFFQNLNLSPYITGAVQPKLSKKSLQSIPIILPKDDEEQKAIADVLSSLDDKIDLLHRQNATLEAMAQTLFRQWFVEEAGDGWEEYQVRDFVTHHKLSIKPEKHLAKLFHHFSIPAFDDAKTPVQELGKEIKSNKYEVVPFSVLVSKLNPRFPRIWDVYFIPEKNSICSTEFQIFKPNSKDYFGFIYYLFTSTRVKSHLVMAASGTSGSHQRVRPNVMLDITFTLPNIERIIKFSKLVEPNLKKKISNQKQIRTLEKLRDTLLPKLMSGKVRVRI
jgi:type I restriction enzyme, S subunit